MKKKCLYGFNYEQCRLIPNGIREASARVIVGKKLNVINSFTLETSFFGYKKQGYIQNYTYKDYTYLAEGLLKSIFNLVEN